MRNKKHNKARVKSVAYAATITWAPGSNDAVLSVAELTGALTLNIVDADAELGDRATILLKADVTGRTVTIGGAQGNAGSVVLGSNAAATVVMVYNSVLGKYVATVTPS